MTESAFLASFKSGRVLRWLAWGLLLLGVLNCISSVYMTAIERAPAWPLLSILIGICLLTISQRLIEKHAP
ncbi:hypothetical protein [Motilimonas sp. E26]|uniref:hypothetical protein n=1 Tax=Motilimonas sp. E26 TaxID=2865674 RepID=UPI001E3721F4|nr:hypothetical protein [Motilimonas sp. E26]MCE0555861.1 hypothetical protein [Motilimonas sp. E26]